MKVVKGKLMLFCVGASRSVVSLTVFITQICPTFSSEYKTKLTGLLFFFFAERPDELRQMTCLISPPASVRSSKSLLLHAFTFIVVLFWGQIQSIICRATKC